MKNIVLAITCLFVLQGIVIAQEIFQTDIIITPKNIHRFEFSGLVGGSGNDRPLELNTEIDWSIGNTIPFRNGTSDDLVFSTCIGDYTRPENWHSRLTITKDGLIVIHGVIRLISPNGLRISDIHLEDTGEIVVHKIH